MAQPNESHFPLCSASVARSQAMRLLSLAALLIVVSGCTTSPPTRQLNAYHNAFQSARQVSEQVLIKAGVDWERAEQLERDVESTTPVDLDAWLELNLNRERAEDWTVDDHITLRLRFWIVAERYNDALLALAEGRSPDQIHDSMLRLSDSISALPIRRMSQLGGPIGALTGLLSETIAMIDNRIAQRRFAEALEHGAPLISQMLQLLEDDVEDFYDLRLVLYRRERVAINESLQLELLPTFRDLYVSTGAADEKLAVFDTVRAMLADELRYREHQLPGFRDTHDADAAYTALDHSQLMTLAQEIRHHGEARRSLDERMRQYQNLLRAYHRLLGVARSQLDGLQRAIAHGDAAPPEEMLFTALAVYRELIRYRRGGMP